MTEDKHSSKSVTDGKRSLAPTHRRQFNKIRGMDELGIGACQSETRALACGEHSIDQGDAGKWNV